MATTYDFIAQNKWKSWLLVGGFMVFLSFLGWAIGEWTDYGLDGLFLAFFIALGMTWVAYAAGDRIALMAAGAQGPITKQQQPYVWNLVENLCIASGTPMPKLYLIDDPSVNAFATGRDPQHASIAVTTGAITQLANEELEGVVAHELSHIRNYDVRYMMFVLVLLNTVTLLARWFWYSGRLGGRRSGRDGGAGILAVVGIVLLILAPIVAQLVRLAVSRRREFLADASGALLTRYPEGLARALEKIQAINRRPLRVNEAVAPLFLADPRGVGRRMTTLLSTHPPIEERIAALRQMAS